MKKILVIGSKLQYEEIDFDFLSHYKLDIYLAYKVGDLPLKYGKSVFYKNLDVSTIVEIINTYSINALACYKDDFIYAASEVRTACDIKGLKMIDAKKYKDKSEMYRHVTNSVTTAPYIHYCSELTFEDIELVLGEAPYFIKPDNLAGAEGSMKIDNQFDFQFWVEKYSGKYKNSIIQPYINQKLYHCEMVVQGGRELYNQARVYSYPNHMFLKGKNILSLPLIDNDLKNRLQKAASLVRESLSFCDGLMHTEFFVSKTGKITFLETNIRQIGGTISLIHKDMLRMSFETILIIIEAGIGLPKFDVNTNDFHYAGYIPMEEGVVEKFNNLNFQGDVSINYRVKIGDKLLSPRSTSNAAASVYAKYNNYNDMLNDFLLLEEQKIVVYK